MHSSKLRGGGQSPGGAYEEENERSVSPTGYVKKQKNKLKKSVYLQKLEKTIENLHIFQEMFGEETKALGENYLEAARIAHRCAQHDQFIITTNSINELHRLQDA